MRCAQLACGIHEARRRIACPVCPRVVRELADEPCGVRTFTAVIGTDASVTQQQRRLGRERLGKKSVTPKAKKRKR